MLKIQFQIPDLQTGHQGAPWPHLASPPQMMESTYSSKSYIYGRAYLHTSFDTTNIRAIGKCSCTFHENIYEVARRIGQTLVCLGLESRDGGLPWVAGREESVPKPYPPMPREPVDVDLEYTSELFTYTELGFIGSPVLEELVDFWPVNWERNSCWAIVIGRGSLRSSISPLPKQRFDCMYAIKISSED